MKKIKNKLLIFATFAALSFGGSTNLIDVSANSISSKATSPFNYDEFQEKEVVKEDEIIDIYNLPRMFNWNPASGKYIGRFYKNYSDDYKEDQIYHLNAQGEYLYYAPIPPEQERVKVYDYDYSRIRENKVPKVNRANSIFYSAPFVDPKNDNVKRGRHVQNSPWNLRKNWDPNGGKMYWNGKYGYEWRNLGYDVTGDLIPNPFFMPDHVGRNTNEGGHPLARIGKYYERVSTADGFDANQQRRTYIVEPEKSNLIPTYKNADGMVVRHEQARPSKYSTEESIRERILREHFLTTDSGKRYLLRHKVDLKVERLNKAIPATIVYSKEERIIESAKFWASRAIITGNPDAGHGTVTFWHLYNKTPYYIQDSLAGTPYPNLRATLFTIQNMKGETIATVRESNETSLEVSPKTLIRSPEVGKEIQPLLPGEEYYVKAVVLNMKTSNPLGLKSPRRDFYLKYMWGERGTTERKIKGWMNEEGSVLANPAKVFASQGFPTNRKNLYPNEKANVFQDKAGDSWKFKVPIKAHGEMKLRFEIPVDYYYAGDNYNTEDDALELILPVGEGDIGTRPQAELLDSKTKEVVKEVVTGKSYDIRYKIFSKEHKRNIGDSKDPKNPYIGLEVEIGDDKNNKVVKVVSKETIKPNGEIELVVENAITPETNCVVTKWQIQQKHRDLRQSTDASNDGPYRASWCGDLNISVEEFKVQPQTIKRTYNAPAGSQRMQIHAEVTNTNRAKESKEVEIIVRGTTSKKEWKWVETIPANKKTPIIRDLGIVPVQYGDNAFEIEVNYPNPVRKFVEQKPDGSNPYVDNIDYNSILVLKNEEPANACSVVHTRNDWAQTYTLRDVWYNWVDPYWVTSCSGEGEDRTCETYNSPRHVYSHTNILYEKRQHFETYSIDKILFKSKITEDKRLGTDGWIDIRNKYGPVKAGYGFDLEVYASYRTNAIDIPPEKRGLSRGRNDYERFVTPQVQVTPPPTAISIKLPFKDEAGRMMVYNLQAHEVEGNWYNRKFKFVMPERKTEFNKTGPSRKIFINEKAKDKKYNARADLESFYGYPTMENSTKLPASDLCDTGLFGIEVKGSHVDDIKTHVIQ